MRLLKSGCPWFLSGLSAVLIPVAMLSALTFAGKAGAETAVYRCTTPSGKIEFRQQPCSEGSNEEEITIEDQKTGWEPGKTKLEGQGEETKKKSSASKSDNKKRAEQAKKQADKCFDKRQQLEEVNWKLRAGYSASEGVKLRHKRRTYEEYLSHYCK